MSYPCGSHEQCHMYRAYHCTQFLSLSPSRVTPSHLHPLSPSLSLCRTHPSYPSVIAHLVLTFSSCVKHYQLILPPSATQCPSGNPSTSSDYHYTITSALPNLYPNPNHEHTRHHGSNPTPSRTPGNAASRRHGSSPTFPPSSRPGGPRVMRPSGNKLNTSIPTLGGETGKVKRRGCVLLTTLRERSRMRRWNFSSRWSLAMLSSSENASPSLKSKSNLNLCSTSSQ